MHTPRPGAYYSHTTYPPLYVFTSPTSPYCGSRCPMLSGSCPPRRRNARELAGERIGGDIGGWKSSPRRQVVVERINRKRRRILAARRRKTTGRQDRTQDETRRETTKERTVRQTSKCLNHACTSLQPHRSKDQKHAARRWAAIREAGRAQVQPPPRGSRTRRAP